MKREIGAHHLFVSVLEGGEFIRDYRGDGNADIREFLQATAKLFDDGGDFWEDSLRVIVARRFHAGLKGLELLIELLENLVEGSGH